MLLIKVKIHEEDPDWNQLASNVSTWSPTFGSFIYWPLKLVVLSYILHSLVNGYNGWIVLFNN